MIRRKNIGLALGVVRNERIGTESQSDTFDMNHETNQHITDVLLSINSKPEIFIRRRVKGAPCHFLNDYVDPL